MLQEASADLTSMAMGGNSARHQGDENLLVKFYKGNIQNELKSRQEGRPIFEEVDCIHIMIPGNKDHIIDRPASQMDINRFPDHYRKFKAREDQSEMEGTPLEEWPGVTRAQAEEFRYINIRTVEQLAAVADNHISNVMGGPVLKQKAAKYLEAAKDNKIAEQLLLTQNENKTLMERMEEMAAEMAALQKAIQPKRGSPRKTGAAED